jgi:hypothetical protein
MSERRVITAAPLHRCGQMVERWEAQPAVAAIQEQPEFLNNA